MLSYPDTASLANMDVSVEDAAFLTESGKEGAWLVRDTADVAGKLAADASGGMYLQSIMDLDKTLARHFEGAINPSWFGWKESNTGSQNKAAITECLSVASLCRERTIRVGAGDFDFDGGVVVPKHLKLEAQGGYGEVHHPGPTRISLNTESFGFKPMQYSYIGGFDFSAGPGYTPSVAILPAGRGVTVGWNGYRGPIECCVDVGGAVRDDGTQFNHNATRILGGYAKGVVDGVRVQQNKSGVYWTNNTAFASGSIHRCTTDWMDFRCLVAHTSPPSGSFAAHRAAYPSYWVEAYHAYGASDIHTGEIGPFDIIEATGIAFGFYNASGWALNNPKAQNCSGYGFLFEHQSRGNKGMVYAESNGVDIYCGTRCHTNEIDASTLIYDPVIQYAPGSKDNNRIRRYRNIGGISQWVV